MRTVRKSAKAANAVVSQGCTYIRCDCLVLYQGATIPHPPPHIPYTGLQSHCAYCFGRWCAYVIMMQLLVLKKRLPFTMMKLFLPC